MRNNPDDLSNQLITKIKNWLKKEIKHNGEILDGNEILSNGSYNIHYGRHECSESLLRKIKEWENEND